MNYIDRIHQEKKFLEEKIGDLINYLNSDNELSEKEELLIELQLKHMKHYDSCLDLRLYEREEDSPCECEDCDQEDDTQNNLFELLSAIAQNAPRNMKIQFIGGSPK